MITCNQKEKESVVSIQRKIVRNILWVVLRKGVSIYSYQKSRVARYICEYISISK